MEALWFAGFVIWLVMGGYALACISSDPPKDGWGDAVVGLFLLCLFLGPFMFGAAVSMTKNEEDPK